jgi:site-specific DNA recombinase
MQTLQTTSQKIRSGAAYIRYSSSMQNDSFSLDAQLRQIKSRAEQDGVVIVKVYSDEARSAYSKKYRPGIDAMLNDAKSGVFEVTYCHKLDRLARKLEWAIEIAKQLTEYGVALKAVEQNFDLETPEGKLMFHLLGSLGEFYSDNLSKETEKGKRERVAQGYHNGQVPWGYVSKEVDGHRMAVPDEKIAPIVHEVFERCASGLYYDQQIADWLNEQGLQNRLGRPFTKDGVRGMLTNPMYWGYVRYRGAFVKGKSRKAAEVLHKGKHKALISEELNKKCQAARSKRRSVIKTRQVTRRVYMMAGVITCVHCGRKMRAQSTMTGSRYYRETSRASGTHCQYSGKSLRADLMEAQLDMLIRRLKLPDDWQEKLEVFLEDDSEIVDVERERAKIKAKIRRLRESYTRGLFEEDEHVFWKETETLQTKLRALVQIPQDDVNKAAQTLVGLSEAWRAATPEEKQELVKIVFEAIYVDLEKKQIVQVKPHSEYNILFQMVEGLEQIEGDLYTCALSVLEDAKS